MKIFAGLLLFCYSLCCFAQNTCVITGPAGYNGTVSACTSCVATCTGAPPPPPSPPPTGCSASQLSSVIGGKTLQRQCTGSMVVYPNGTQGGSDFSNLGKVFNNTSFPTYAFAGSTPTFTVQSGYYIAMVFTPTVTGAFQLVANPSYGDGGTISLSTTPGAITTGSAGSICVLNRGGANSLYVGTSAPICVVHVGTTYYVNMADIDIYGNNLCYKGRPNSCSSSQMAFTIYTSN